MGDRDRAAEALERLRAIEPRASEDSDIDRHRRQAIEHLEELVGLLDQAQTTDKVVETPEKPDDWEDEETWKDKLDIAYSKAGITPSKGTLTTKTINGRDYYYLQWRESEKVKSQYVAPVDPA